MVKGIFFVLGGFDVFVFLVLNMILYGIGMVLIGVLVVIGVWVMYIF